MGKTEATMRMEIEVIDQKDGDYDAHNGWGWKPFIIRPVDVPRLFSKIRAHVITMACGGGREEWGKAFLEAGCQSYTGFDVGTNEGSDAKAFTIFTITLFYFLLTESVVGDGGKLSMADAVRRATAIDKEYRHGTGGFRIFER
jgi:hypothetical protein